MVPTYVNARAINDSIVAIVNNEVITLKDLKDYIAGVYRQLKIEHKTDQEIQEIISSYDERGVNQLIEDKLILDAANQKGIIIRPEIVEKRMKEIKSRYLSEDDFLAEIISQGLTVTDLKNKIINQMKSKFQVDIEVRDKIFVNPEDVTQYYNNHKNDFETKTKYDLDSIFISYDQGKDVANTKIKEARLKLTDGADFQAIAKEYSQGPSVGVLEQGQMVAAIEREVFSLKLGEISQPVSVDSGVYLFKVKEIVPGTKQSLQEVKNDIYNKLSMNQFQEKFKVWIDKLREKAYVEIRN
jgi:parvulin-like peptidyl-prolyl isomerase